MKTIQIKDIQVLDRQRKEIGQKALEDLARSIHSKGLLHAIVLSQEADGTFRLRAGERRLRAMDSLHESNLPFTYDGQLVPENHVPYVLTADLDETELHELELEENLRRENLTWMEETEAKANLHKLRQGENPLQTFKETGREVAKLKGTTPTYEDKAVARAVLIQEHKNNPRVKKAKSAEEAYKAILDEGEQRFLARLNTSTINQATSPHKIIKGDCREILKTLPPATINTIICDPPYGIEADKAGQESKHFYDDSADNALDICKTILREGFRLAASRATLFMFCDIEHFIELRTYAQQQAWTVFRTPIIWDKTRGSRAPWGRAGFQRSYELILFAVKGQDELVYPGGRDILSFAQDNKNDRTHAANKPEELLDVLIKLTTLPGELILDPCAGSGSIIPAADRRKARTICIELDETYYSQAMARLTIEPREPTPLTPSDSLPEIDI
jgi:site-specific DNA-methyltransferase (adenine-specific)